MRGKTLTVGNELVEQLKDNDDLEWHFVTEKKRRKKGSMMVHIIWSSPFRRTFQKNASTVMDDEPKKMNLTYDVNPDAVSFLKRSGNRQRII